MIVLLVCHCMGAEKKARKVVKDGGSPNYLTVPCYVDKKNCSLFLDNLPLYLKSLPNWKPLYDFIQQNNSYSIVLGYNAKNLAWANVRGKNLEQVTLGERIAEIFA